MRETDNHNPQSDPSEQSDGSDRIETALQHPAPSAKTPSADELTPMKCSCCGQPYFKEESLVVPFCSKRCHQVDLGLWLTESYGFPIESGDEALPPNDDDQDL